MYEKFKRIIGRLNEKAFIAGLFLVALFFGILFTYSSWEELCLIILTVPGFFILHYSLFPDSKHAKYGKYFFDLHRYIKRDERHKDLLRENADIQSIKQNQQKESYDLTATRFNQVFPFLEPLREALRPLTSTLARLLKPLIILLWKPLCIFLFLWGALFRIFVQWPYRSVLYILAGFPALIFLVMRFDLLNQFEFTLPGIGSVNIASLLFMLVLYLPVIVYALLLWRACQQGLIKDATILGMPKSWKPSYVQYSYEHAGGLYEYAMPASSHFMNAYGQMPGELDKLKYTQRFDPRNLAGSVKILINPDYPQVHCLLDGVCQTLYDHVKTASKGRGD